ncbi:ParA family protein, partial [Aerococcus urinaeequi]|uniref:ParA family protein n=2 Tax=Aerococcus urinaeequi TaxID=51665 RepID=UPI003D6B0BFE
TKHLSKTLRPIKDEYDFIIIDTPPTISLYTDNALMASDQVVIVMQTQERSLDGALGYVIYLNQLIENYDADYDVLGILPVLLKNTSKVDKNILNRATEEFGENNMFENVIKNMERLKRYDVMGIGDPNLTTDYDRHDKDVFKIYENITNELLERLESK